MIKPVLELKICFAILLVLGAFSFLGFQPSPNQTGGIILKDEQLPFSPKEFYIDSINDERSNRSAVAWLLPTTNTENQAKTYPVDFQGGCLSALRRFVSRNLPSDKTMRPVAIRLKEFKAVETALPGRRVEGQITLAISFYLERSDAEMLHLVDYKGNASYNRNAGPPQEIEPTLRHVLANSLTYLNTWMNQQAATNIKLAKAVKINFTDYNEKPEGDSIYYSVQRPLTWDDFQSKIPVSRYDAEVFPTIGYDEHAEVDKGIINVTLALKVVLPKSAAWAKETSRSNYSLNHEQRHFDIVKIVAEHFKQKLSAEDLTVSNYDGIINFDYLEAYREMSRLQKQYDGETRHGSEIPAQQKWNEKIDKELRAYGIKK